MIYFLWLLMFGFCGGLSCLAIGFLSGVLPADFCVLLAGVFFIFSWLTAMQIEEWEECK